MGSRHNRRIHFDPKYDPPQRRETMWGIRQMRDDSDYVPLPWDAPSNLETRRPGPFQLQTLALVSSMVANTETDLVGPNGTNQNGVGVPDLGPAPAGGRVLVDCVKPVAVDAFSNPVSVLPPGTTVIWRLYVGNRVVQGFEAFTLFPGDSDEVSHRSLLEVPSGSRLRVTVQVVANGMGLLSVGIRMAGTIEPSGRENSQWAGR